MIRAVGLLILALLAGIFVTPVIAQDSQIWAGGAAYVRLQPTQAPNAVAEVEFLNGAVHGNDVLDFILTVGVLSVAVTADVGHGDRPDYIMVTPPEGFIAVPQRIEVAEGATGRVLLFSDTGLGS
jgi:hypothetical protein